MHISDDLYTDIRAAIGIRDPAPLDAPGTPGVPHRDDARAEIAVEVEVEPYGVCNPRRRKVMLKDFSAGGVSWIDGFTLAANDKLIIHLPRASIRQTVPIVCEVRNCRVGDGHFRVGAEFIMGDTTQAEFVVSAQGVYQRHNDARVKLKNNCGRSAPRTQVRARVQLHLSGASDRPGPVLEADLADISKTGAGVTCNQPLLVGQKLMAVIHLANRDRPFTQMAVVVNCREIMPGKFRTGVRFGSTGVTKKGLFASLFGN